METWATVVIVLGTNLITSLSTWFLTKRQLEHSDKQLEKQLEAQREAVQHNRKWDVRSQPLLKLRVELAQMAEKLQGLVDLATQVIDGVAPNLDKKIDDLNKAAKDWDAYISSGEFYQAIHMQYDPELQAEAHKILLDYQSAYTGVMAYWQGGNADKKIIEAKDVMKRNAARISTIQSKINKLLEEL